MFPHIFWLHLKGAIEWFLVAQVVIVRTNSCNLQGYRSYVVTWNTPVSAGLTDVNPQ